MLQNNVLHSSPAICNKETPGLHTDVTLGVTTQVYLFFGALCQLVHLVRGDEKNARQLQHVHWQRP